MEKNVGPFEYGSVGIERSKRTMTVENSFDQRLYEEARTLGADFFGVADLSPAQELVQELFALASMKVTVILIMCVCASI